MGTLIVLLLGALILGLILWDSIRFGISPMPTTSKIKKQLLGSLPKTIGGTIYELGAGWGTLAFALARKYPNNQVIAIEGSRIPYLVCSLRNYFEAHPNLHFSCGDFFKSPLINPGLIVCFLYKDAMEKLKPKISKEAPKALVVSHTFAIGGWKPTLVERVNDIYQTPIYHYSVSKQNEIMMQEIIKPDKKE